MGPDLGRPGEDPLRRHRNRARRLRMHGVGRDPEPVVAREDRPRLRPEPHGHEVARALPGPPHHREQHGCAHGGRLHRARDRRRPLPLERDLPHPGAREADRGLGRLRGDFDGSAVRAALRPGDADSVDAAVHRERGPSGRMRLRLRLRIYRYPQLGLPHRTAADDPRSAGGLRHALRSGRNPRGARRAPAGQPQHPGLDRGRGGRAEDGAGRGGPGAAGAVPGQRAGARAPHSDDRGAERER